MTALALILVAGAEAAQAQASAPITIDSLKAGERVRVWAKPPWLEGDELVFLRADSQTIVVTLRTRLDSLAGIGPAIARADVIRLDVRRGRRTSSGFVIGSTIAGLGAGALIGGLAGAIMNNHTSGTDGMGVVVMAPFGAVAGSIAGVVIGAHGHATWQSVMLGRHSP